MISKITALLITCMCGSFGQMFVRINLFNGSLDKPWLLIPIFWIPPFSIVPTIMVYFDWLEKGKGGTLYDNAMYAVMISSIIPIIIEKLEFIPDKLKPFVNSLLLLATTIGAFYTKELTLCEKYKIEPNLNRIARNSAIVNLTIAIIPMIIGFIPYLGTGLVAIGVINDTMGMIIDVLLRVGSAFFVMLLLNMYEGSYGEDYCKTNPSTSDTTYWILGSLLATVGIQFTENIEQQIVGKVLDEGMKNSNISFGDDDE